MKFGVREICDVVLKAKTKQVIGNKVFYKGEPVIYFDTLKTSSMEGAATTVYAQGGRGNSRLMAWEGERTVTFTMEDALISPAGFMILSGAGLIDATNKQLNVHITESTEEIYFKEDPVDSNSTAYVIVKQAVSEDDGAGIYIMAMTDGEITTEPFIGKVCKAEPPLTVQGDKTACETALKEGRLIEIKAGGSYTVPQLAELKNADAVMVDYYTIKDSGAQQIEITPDKFGGNYYLEASTLFRNRKGVDMPAEFIIPNCKIQSNFTFTMASSGDPSTFTFTMDAFPDYTRFDKSHKVLAAIQIISDELDNKEPERTATNHVEDALKTVNFKIDLANKKGVFQSGGNHGNIVIDGQKVATTNEIVKFEGERPITFLAEQFKGANGLKPNGEKDLDYEVTNVEGTKLTIQVKNPDKAVNSKSTYKLVGGIGSHYPQIYYPVNTTIEKLD